MAYLNIKLRAAEAAQAARKIREEKEAAERLAHRRNLEEGFIVALAAALDVTTHNPAFYAATEGASSPFYFDDVNNYPTLLIDIDGLTFGIEDVSGCVFLVATTPENPRLGRTQQRTNDGRFSDLAALGEILARRAAAQAETERYIREQEARECQKAAAHTITIVEAERPSIDVRA